MNLIILFILLINPHAGHQAFFTLESSEAQIILSVKIDEADLKVELSGEGARQDNVELAAAQYILSNFKCEVNEKPVAFTFESAHAKEGFLNLKLAGDIPKETIEMVTIQNTSFMKYNHSFENVVQIALRGKPVTYRMDQKRTNISHKY